MADNPNPNSVKDRLFGELNDVSKPQVRKRFSLEHDQTIAAMAAATRDTYVPNGLANVGEFKGIALKVISGPGAADGDQTMEKGGWFSSFFGDESSTSDVSVLVEVKVRVPEVHSMLPIPDAIGPDAPPDQQAIMDMYPTFVAQSLAVQSPAPGDLVWVDWGNRQNWTDPYYIRPVKEIAVGGAAGGAAGRDAHKKPCVGSYDAQTPKGDPVAAKNAALPAHIGLPRLKRIQKPKGKPVLHEGDAGELRGAKMPLNKPTKAQWKKTVEKQLPPGKSWMGICKNQGMDDEKFKASRSNIIWYSNSTDFKQPWELMYFFHGLNEFTGKTFEKQIAPQISTAVAQGRNFVLVMPELPWSKEFGGKRQSSAFKEPKQFEKYHTEILDSLQSLSATSATQTAPTPSFISIYAHSAGGGALKNIAQDLQTIKPNRLFLSDCDYTGVTSAVWKRYISTPAGKDAWMTCITTKGKTRKATEKVFKDEIKEVQKTRELYHIKTKKSHSWCGENCMITISDELIERQKKKEVAKKKEADKEKPGDDEGQNVAGAGDNPDAKKAPGVEQVPKKDPEGAPPPVQAPAETPSKQSKKSETSKKSDFKTAKAVEYEENRVYLKEYGGSLVGKAADELLVRVDDPATGQRLHKLVAVRYNAMKAAAAQASADVGGPFQLKISSGWRRHRWKNDRKIYNAFLAKNYPKGNGKTYLAFNSPHESGLAFDLKCHGLYASKGGSKTIGTQEKTKLFAWLKENAHKYGFTPYKAEPWHWECRLPWDAYASGEEFVKDKDYEIKVTYIGGKNAQLPSGPSTGGSKSGSPSKDKKCVRTGRDGKPSAPPGPYKPGIPYKVTGGGKCKLTDCEPPKEGGAWGDHPGCWSPEMTLFVLHETGGWGYSQASSKRRLGNRPVKKFVQYWGAADGSIQQCAHPSRVAGHANCTNKHSIGIEVHCFGTTSGNGYAKWEKKVAMGIHIISKTGKGDIAVEPGDYRLASNTPEYHLPNLKQCEAAWQLAILLSKNPPSPPPEAKWSQSEARNARIYGIPQWSGTSKINIPIAFPTGVDGDKFWWAKWNGGPTRDMHSAHAWFRKHRPKGITSHARIHNHQDGVNLEYYCYARAVKKMSPKNAFWAMVGAICTGNWAGADKGCWTPLPNAKMVAIGKKKYPAAWFKAKSYRLVGKKKWKQLAAANPQWFANAEIAAAAAK